MDENEEMEVEKDTTYEPPRNDVVADQSKDGPVRNLRKKVVWIPKVREFVDVRFDSDRKFEPQKWYCGTVEELRIENGIQQARCNFLDGKSEGWYPVDSDMRKCAGHARSILPKLVNAVVPENNYRKMKNERRREKRKQDKQCRETTDKRFDEEKRLVAGTPKGLTNSNDGDTFDGSNSSKPFQNVEASSVLLTVSTKEGNVIQVQDRSLAEKLLLKK
jgi:hypothetical protein